MDSKKLAKIAGFLYFGENLWQIDANRQSSIEIRFFL